MRFPPQFVSLFLAKFGYLHMQITNIIKKYILFYYYYYSCIYQVNRLKVRTNTYICEIYDLRILFCNLNIFVTYVLFFCQILSTKKVGLRTKTLFFQLCMKFVSIYYVNSNTGQLPHIAGILLLLISYNLACVSSGLI